MERLIHNLHVRLQEMCDCYMDTDYLSQLERMTSRTEKDLEEEAIKYLALAIMYATTERAKKLSLKKEDKKIKIKVTTEEEIALPPPERDVADQIFSVMRAITHIEGEEGETELALGLRNSQLALKVKLKQKEGKQSLKFVLPEL